jgi:hypothetical protein
MSERKQVTIYISEKLHRKIKMVAVSRDVEMSDIASEAISCYISEPVSETEQEKKYRMLSENKWYTKNRWRKISGLASSHISNIMGYLSDSNHEFKREYLSRFEAELDSRGVYDTAESEMQ